ncbi:MAG: glycosyltransferase family 2 protein [Prevotellaceae bacterium]|jgi:GT2 family glycosyltransferase|nr:glycosyltransferase family 2 protein [Prevotellaceae bacterium]
MKISIVILSYNGRQHLEKYLPGVIRHSHFPLLWRGGGGEVEIVVADNASTDDSVSFLQTNFPGIKLLQFDRNYGFAGGYNLALKELKADYYVLLNSDVEVTENWLVAPIQAMEGDSTIAACQPKILSDLRRGYFEHAGAAGGFIDKLGFPFCRGRILTKLEKDKGQYDDIADIFWATGASLFIRSEAFHGAGGFDARFFAHMEEIDLCWRLKSRGHRIVCTPQSKVYHLGGGTLKVENPHKTYLNFRNNLLMLYKNLPASHLRKTLFVRLFFDYAAMIQMIFTGNFKNAQEVVRARRDFHRMKKEMQLDRRENLRLTIIQKPYGIFFQSIILKYYFCRRTKFSQLKISGKSF